jgi:phage shock protein A
MGRFFRTIRGFFGRLLSGVEQRNPEILLENAVQDELNNLKKLQVAAARTMAYEKMLTNDAATKQKVVAAKEHQARELTARGQREAAIEVVQQKQEAQTSLAEIEGRLEEARKNSEEMERAFLMEEHQRARALRTANEARSSVSLSDSSRDLERARQAIRQSSYEAEAVGELGTSETERQIAAAEVDIKRLDAERELEMIELQMGLRDADSLESPPSEGSDEEVTPEAPNEAQAEGSPDEEERSRG